MSVLQHTTTSNRRRTMRRAVNIDCQVLSDLWDGSAPYLATNLSPYGLWLSTCLPLEIGEEVLVTLRPPRWERSQPLVALAEVARVGLYRRVSEQWTSGMGLRFTDLDEGDRLQLCADLRGLPPPLPQRYTQVVAEPRQVASATRLLASRPSIMESDEGLFAHLVAEAPLLTGGRALPGDIRKGAETPNGQVIDLRPRLLAQVKSARHEQSAQGIDSASLLAASDH